MIRYSLICENGHEFDGWFGRADAFEAQVAAGEVSCPHCGSTALTKALMTPAVGGPRHGEETGAGDETPVPAFAETAEGPQAEVLSAIRELKRQLVASADYVGDHFAEEARRIHYDEAPARGIYGEATAEEARGLIEEGIEFHPLPILPDERN